MQTLRIGQSTDIHRLEENLPLVIGGVKIDYSKGCVAHSDGDVLVHAITEAIIGALGLGDLGSFFSDLDDSNKDRNSLEMLKEINDLMQSKNYSIVNIDTLVLLEEPKLKKYTDDMKKNIAEVLKIDCDKINIKATRGEKVGFIGRGDGIMAQAVILIDKNER
ncbi:2-C-methyl-D-erythritol 2,4-cyclodiphosphate synthase [Bacilli bacterium PM5-3]|nr:2-C-methyl-D-erythritol 2,4-cyclodiphosphate synthase [Bacilli bacterium PM5-3]MDH6603314.1 2-C-methyl-D-erythritol 2,4-cyclodiphosphate synthase [Bacilli bacterium PM5-9]